MIHFAQKIYVSNERCNRNIHHELFCVSGDLFFPSTFFLYKLSHEMVFRIVTSWVMKDESTTFPRLFWVAYGRWLAHSTLSKWKVCRLRATSVAHSIREALFFIKLSLEKGKHSARRLAPLLKLVKALSKNRSVEANSTSSCLLKAFFSKCELKEKAKVLRVTMKVVFCLVTCHSVSHTCLSLK